jgi:hypothetical protein
VVGFSNLYDRRLFVISGWRCVALPGHTPGTSVGLGRNVCPHYSVYLPFSSNTFATSFIPQILQLWTKSVDKLFTGKLRLTEKAGE